jgi:adenosylcobinamide kinase / adenosylcobinamide-phosphate guanylyltransferase
MNEISIARSELILGGQKSGKTARAETLADAWLIQSPQHAAVYVATAQAGDAEMEQRIARHRSDRARRVPGMVTVEAPFDVAGAVRSHSSARTLVVVDCLTLWLTGWLMPAGFEARGPGAASSGEADTDLVLGLGDDLIADLLAASLGPLVLVSNEIGLGVIPMGRDVRAFVDALGLLNQRAAAACERVTLMAAGLPLALKGAA